MKAKAFVIVMILVLVAVVAMCAFALWPRKGTKPTMVKHGMSNQINLSLNHLPQVQDAYVVEDTVVFPVALFNGALPLIMMHVGESGSHAAAIIDTASEHLLLADVERCQTCSTHMFGGARHSDSKHDAKYGQAVVEFGSQRDHVEYRVEDVYLDEFNVPKLKFGLVTHRESLTSETRITYNIMGVGGAQHIKDAFLNRLHAKLRPHKHRFFGFMLGKTGNDYVDEHGIFTMGKIPKTLLPDRPIVSIPMHAKPISLYYYTTHAEKIIGHLRNGMVLVYPLTNFPVMFDTGSNYTDCPLVMQKQFHLVDTWEFVFPHNTRLTLPNSALMWNRRPNSPLVNFSNTNILTIGTVALSKFKAIEFQLDAEAFVHIYAR